MLYNVRFKGGTTRTVISLKPLTDAEVETAVKLRPDYEDVTGFEIETGERKEVCT